MLIDTLKDGDEKFKPILEGLTPEENGELGETLKLDRDRRIEMAKQEYPENTDEVEDPIGGKKLKLLMIEHGYKEIKSIVGNSPRGDWYMYAKIWDNKLVGIGEEQGNYIGGDLATSRNKERLIELLDRLKKSYEDYLKTGTVTYESSLYEQIKDYEIADSYPGELGHYH